MGMPFADNSNPSTGIFHFRKGPTYRTASADEWKTAIETYQRRQQEYRDFQLIASLTCIVAIAVIAFVIAKRRKIASTAENALVSTLATGVVAAQKARSYTSHLKSRVDEKLAGNKTPPSV